jgi:iron donor protein CyaY
MTLIRRSSRCFEAGDREAKKRREAGKQGSRKAATVFTAETLKAQGEPSYGGYCFMAMMDEQEFQRKSDAAFEALRKRLLELGDENEFEVEGGSGKLEIEFEDEDETRFVISPNAPVRQIWISALTTSFKLGWSDAAQAFVQEKTGETLNQVMSRILSEKLGTAIQV